ncbi:hypothetical protein NERG_01131 [Nematocida ausubeli]|uniref:Uncharacterized protein n=1 Tax=Nematocida ausubeli (strain ATCC PRA-371 / ERTm2) TaxID=1913371 RepID=H8ZCY4_NEMA1|nr:hypothetical protein NERG_01131 [Nematocida ausubeli]
MHTEVSAGLFKEFLKKNKSYLNAMVEKETMMCLVRRSNAEYAKKLSRVMIYEKHAKDLVVLTDTIKTAQELYAEGVQNLRNILCTMLDVHEKHTSLILEIYKMIKSAKVIPAINSKPQTKYENT